MQLRVKARCAFQHRFSIRIDPFFFAVQRAARELRSERSNRIARSWIVNFLFEILFGRSLREICPSIGSRSFQAEITVIELFPHSILSFLPSWTSDRSIVRWTLMGVNTRSWCIECIVNRLDGEQLRAGLLFVNRPSCLTCPDVSGSGGRSIFPSSIQLCRIAVHENSA